MKRDPILEIDDIAPVIVKKANIQSLDNGTVKNASESPNQMVNYATVRNYPYPRQGDFSSVNTTLAAIPTEGPKMPSEQNQYIIFVYPGSYDEPKLVVPSWVSIRPATASYNEFILKQAIGRVNRADSHKVVTLHDLYHV